MKKLRQIIITLILLLFIVPIIYSQEVEEFPVGVFIGAGRTDPHELNPSNDENFWQIEQMGVNYVIAIPTENNQDSLKRFNIIASRPLGETDYIQHYSSALYSKWEVEEGSEFTTGMKRNGGLIEGDYYTSGYDYDDKPNFLSGPNYAQEKKYKLNAYNTNPINYKVRIRFKIDGPPSEIAENVCKITLEYKYKHGDPLTLATHTIGTPHYLNTNHATGNWRSFEIGPFDYSSLISSFGLDEGTIISDIKLDQFTDTEPGLGLNIKFEYFGMAQRKLYIDFIEVYDNYIGFKIADNDLNILPNIQNQLNQYTTITEKIKYWYSLDEPYAIDYHYPYKMVDDILVNLGYTNQRLITAHYPSYLNDINGDNVIKRFVEHSQPAQYMFDYYPVKLPKWEDSTNVHGSFSLLSNLSYLLQSAHQQSPNFYYIPQAHQVLSMMCQKHANLHRLN